MRRKEFEITDQESIMKIIDKCKTIRLGLITDGKPYILPMVFGYEWTEKYPVFYLHMGMSGRKNQALTEGALICFEMDIEGDITGRTEYANGYSREFCSIMGEGVISFAERNKEKIAGFQHIMEHQTDRSNYTYQEGWLALTQVFSLQVTEMSAAAKGMLNSKECGPAYKDMPIFEAAHLESLDAEEGFSF